MHGVRTFPERVWEPTGTDAEGRTLWSGRKAYQDDHRRRREYLARYRANRLEGAEPGND